MTEPGALRFLPAGDTALLVELADLGQALTLLDALLSDPVPGLEDLVPAARTVLIHFNPLQISLPGLKQHIRSLDLSHQTSRGGRDTVIPVSYDGPDLDEVAGLLGCDRDTLIRRHQDADWTVAFCGFAPGFAYLSGSDTGLVVPRRPSPRLRIPAGSVALAGAFCGIYPSDSPGGWQLIGRTGLEMWNLDRERPALLAPGDRVHFRDISKGAQILLDPPAPPVPAREEIREESTHGTACLRILRTERDILIQDEGRPGQAAMGVSVAGAADRQSFRRANRLLGNPKGTPALELMLGGAVFRAEAPVTLVLTGAPAPMTIRRAAGGQISPAPELPFGLDAGDELVLGNAGAGLFCYLALRGGFVTDPVLASSSRDTLAKIGPEPLTAGAQLRPAARHAQSVADRPELAPALPAPGAIVDLDVIPGPRQDWFTEDGLEHFCAQPWQVTAQSNRIGKRLMAPEAIAWRSKAELPSEATVPGSIQVPHNGQPVLFLADHPLTGGYPVIGVVASYHLGLAAQIPPGAFIRFRPVSQPDNKAEP